MPSWTSLTKVLCLTVACCTLFACGKVNEKAPALNSTNSHPADWRTAHRVAYRQKPDSCRECHGIDLKGGITKVGCSTDSCHAGNHPPRAIIHPVPFKGTADLNMAHGSLAKMDLTICQDCHGTTGGAGSNPRFNLVYGNLPAGCESSGCHNANMAHPKPWKAHSSSGNQANACALCHGANYEGGVGPSCKSCHTQLQAGLLPVAGQCTSCHGYPPNGSVAPNKSGSHATHLALAGMSANCAACHTGGGSGTANHATTLTVSIATTFGPADSFNGTTCSNISCHGGQISPAWGGSLDVIANCTGCHQSAVTYPGYHTGQHSKHLSVGLLCTDCHDMSNQSAHFGNVTTKLFETLPHTTLRSYLSYDKTAQVPTCLVSSTLPPGVQFTGCHSDTRKWQ
ncbi:MAG: CxxxxCH/CxxCH domain-containing protein [Desulfuromonadaceae bacterium]|nr:CxxxxCH/CxxCH domain-containing protein [Desulfuromonadaceae bacterium]